MGAGDYSTMLMQSAPDAKAKRSLPDPAAGLQPTSASSLAEPVAPASESRTGPTAQPISPGSTTAAPSQSAARDFGQIVDRLARAREAEQPDFVQSTLTTRDFGTVSMQLRPLEGRLHVAMTSADPGFAPAVQAASSVAGTGQQALSDSSNQSQSQQQGQSAQQSGQGQPAPDGQARRQHWERAVSDRLPQGPANPSGNEGATRGTDPRGAASDSIYA